MNLASLWPRCVGLRVIIQFHIYIHLSVYCFVVQQRYFYRRRLKGESTSLTDCRIKQLADLGFSWKAPSQSKSNKVGVVDVKIKDDVVEKDKEIHLPDGSAVHHATKASTQRRMVSLEDGSEALETTTKTYTTKVDTTVVPSDETVAESDDNDTFVVNKDTSSQSGMNTLINSKDKLTYADGSTVIRTTEETSKKRMIVLPDGTHRLEITTTICNTAVERTVLPKESEGSSKDSKTSSR